MAGESTSKKGGAIWLKNMCGMTVTDAEMEDVSNPRLELLVHISTKTIQMGALFGMLAIGPVTQLVKGPRTIQAIAHRALKYGANGIIIGAAAGPVVTYGSSRKFEYENYYDRSYRLRYNRGQVITDRMCYFGMAIGAGAGYATGIGILPGIALGVVVGTSGSVFAPGKGCSQDNNKTKESVPVKTEDNKDA
ncbi:unnamed protein product [Owenia fusiformis]|uniref:Uncharacterized protein n=1 Tax=Owenia fusiformis TaxID=6347 RepID=A0A8S4NQV7_OWEFU|nr:unnamed protein product [Owenia fusiformis]